VVSAQVPDEYIANYEIGEDYQKILDYFVQIDAKTKLGEPINKDVFRELYDSFEIVFPHFPKEYEFKVIYEQCLLTTEKLASNYSHQRLAVFMEKCNQPFTDIV